jgi:serine protease
MRSIILFFLIFPISLVFGQKQKQVLFKLPAHARYTQGKLLAKVKAEFKGQSLPISGGRMNNAVIYSIKPIIKPELAKKASSMRGPRAAAPVVDISRYLEINYDPSQNIEDVINQLYATGYYEILEPAYVAKVDFNPDDPSIANQYYLKTIRAIEAWNTSQGSETLTIAIVDTGGDLDHPDLVDNLYMNPGEIPNNGIDDDLDGYIDNFRGWDFVGADTLNLINPDLIGDNDPSTTRGDGVLGHGTWVAGCASARANNGIGIAGVGFKTKIMFTKHTADNEKGEASVHLGYAGILYAASQGIKIINCSWGGPFRSQIAQDLINHVVLDLGSIVISSAGNENQSTPDYPAAYDNVLSVAATDANDKRASFSNYGETIDISAPGVAIYSTSFNNDYKTVNGTSFSSPITAGAAALVWEKFPTFTPLQVAEQLRVTADDQALYGANPNFPHQLGKGRLDIVRALTLSLPSVHASNPKFVNQNGLDVQPGEKGFLTLSFTNYLAATTSGIQISISTVASGVGITKSTISPGTIGSNSTIRNTLAPFELTIGQAISENTSISLLITYTDGTYTDYQTISFIVNPSFVDANSNLVTTSISNIGRIGYQDPANSGLGSGFVFNEQSLLFEMGLMIGNSTDSLYNNVRGAGGIFDQDFFSTSKITKIIPGNRAYEEITGSFTNSNTVSKQVVNVTYRSLAWKNSPDDKFVILEYKIKNPLTHPLHNFHFGIFADWDISPSNDAANWDAADKLGYVYPAQTSTKPYAGIQLLTGNANYYAIDHDQNIPGNPFGTYDGFTDVEKITTLTTSRLSAGAGTGSDVGHVVSAGPLTIGAGQEITLAFALHAAVNFNDLKASAKYADTIYNYTLKAPQPAISNVNTCYHSAATLTATGAAKFKWYKTSTGGEAFFTGNQYVTGVLDSDTVFYVSNADHTYESVRTPATVTIKASPAIITSGSTAICPGQSIILSAADADSYSWSSGQTTKAITVSAAGSFSVTVRDNSLACEFTSQPVVTTMKTSPVAKFSIAGTLEPLKPVIFNDESTDAVSWFWQFGDGVTSAQQDPAHAYALPLNNIDVTLTATGLNGCQNTTVKTISIVTGLEDPTDEIYVYPNPVSGNDPLLVGFTNQAGVAARVSLTNMLGQPVYEEDFQAGGGLVTREISMKNLAEGIFVLKVKFGSRVMTKKIVKAP